MGLEFVAWGLVDCGVCTSGFQCSWREWLRAGAETTSSNASFILPEARTQLRKIG